MLQNCLLLLLLLLLLMTLTPIVTSKVVWWTLMRGCTKQWFNYAPFSVESPSIVDQLMKLKETWYPPLWPPLVAAKKPVENHAAVSSLWSIYLTSVRSSCLELSHGELDMAIMGQLVAGMNTSPTVSVAARHKEVDREEMYTALFHQGKPVCLRMFQFIHTVGKKWMQNLMDNVKENWELPGTKSIWQREQNTKMCLVSYLNWVCRAVFVLIRWAECIVSASRNSWIHPHRPSASTI